MVIRLVLEFQTGPTDKQLQNIFFSPKASISFHRFLQRTPKALEETIDRIAGKIKCFPIIAWKSSIWDVFWISIWSEKLVSHCSISVLMAPSSPSQNIELLTPSAVATVSDSLQEKRLGAWQMDPISAFQNQDGPSHWLKALVAVLRHATSSPWNGY